MLIDQIHSKRTQINTLARSYGASRIRVFGSVVRGEESHSSDVDLLVNFPLGYDLFAQRIPLTNDLSKLLHRQVDLVPEHELNRHLRETVLAEAVDI